MDWNLTYMYTKRTGMIIILKSKKIVGRSKLKLWTFSEVMVTMNDLYLVYISVVLVQQLLAIVYHNFSDSYSLCT